MLRYEVEKTGEGVRDGRTSYTAIMINASFAGYLRVDLFCGNYVTGKAENRCTGDGSHIRVTLGCVN